MRTRPTRIEIEVSNIKMLREALCIAQTEIGDSRVNWADSVIDHLQELIDGLDKHRPLGPDGNHGDRHTETCGCDR